MCGDRRLVELVKHGLLLVLADALRLAQEFIFLLVNGSQIGFHSLN